ncbi:MAG: hypothetical protein HKN51_01635 [Saprospiraceae bacterium]|nr:hypothetical protein [Saprospiraceae bacterium]
MTNNTDNFSKEDVDSIKEAASYICSNKDCRKLTIAPSHLESDKIISTGSVIQITSDSGILLCTSCADEFESDKEKLSTWKADHLEWVSKNINIKNKSGESKKETQRHVDDDLKVELDEYFAKHKKGINITAALGHPESLVFAEEILSYLLEKGYNANGIGQMKFNPPIDGIKITQAKKGNIDMKIGPKM